MKRSLICKVLSLTIGLSPLAQAHAADTQVPQTLRLVAPAESFDLRMSSVLAQWLAEAGDTATTDDIAFAFKRGTGRGESLDVLTLGRLATLRAIAFLAYYAPEVADKLLSAARGSLLPAPYSANMLTYAVDVAALELQQLFVNQMKVQDSDELKLLILALFKRDFMKRSFVDVKAMLDAVLAQSTESRNNNSRYNTLGDVLSFFDNNMSNLDQLHLKQFSGTDEYNPTTVTVDAKQLKIDFSGLTCYNYYDLERDYDYNTSAQYNNNFEVRYARGQEVGTGRDVMVFLDNRGNTGWDMSNTSNAGAAYAIQDELSSIRYEMQNWSIGYPLPPHGSPLDTKLVGTNNDWYVVHCLEQTGSQWNLRYMVIRLRDDSKAVEAAPEMSENDKRDIALRQVLKSINQQYWALQQERATRLNNYIVSENPKMEDLATKELTGELIDVIFKHDLNPADTTIWRNIHAKRPVPDGSSTPQAQPGDYNAIGYEVNIPALHVIIN